ncbi:MAG: nucleotidyltransferase domain-containing protein [Microcoleus sp. Co-bin12]|jgi:predicted nucleotidyltransferase|nr:nucleotidyltransferase domain-containing protein [Microcoleus sp. Co-bin12]
MRGVKTWQEAGISPEDARRIQNAADRTKQTIIVVGSRANGTSTPTSDWDYIMLGKSRQRHSASSSVPREVAAKLIVQVEKRESIFLLAPSSQENLTLYLSQT